MSTTRVRLDVGLVVLLLLPVVLLAVNQNWIFNFPGWADQWIYFGNQQNPVRKLHLFGDSHRTARHSFDLPGTLCYSLLPPLPARIAFHLGFYYAAVFSFYAIGKRTLGMRPALLGAVLMGCYPLFLSSIGWDYIDGACQAYFLLSLWCVLKGTDGERHRYFLALAGTCFAAGVFAYPLLLLFTPLLAILYISQNARDDRVSLIGAIGRFSAGFLGLTLVFCLVHFVSAGKFFFFLPSVAFTANFVTLKGVNPVPTGWLWTSSWVAFPAMVFVCTPAWCWLQRASRSATVRAACIFQLSHAGLFLAFCGCQLFLQMPCLHIPFFISFLTPVMFLAFAGMIQPAIDRLPEPAFWGVLAGALLLALVPLCPGLRPELSGLVTPHAVWASAAALGMLLLLAGVFPRAWVAPILAITAVTSGAMISFAPSQARVFDGHGIPGRDIHLAMAQSHEHLREVWPRQPYRFWYPATDSLTKIEFFSSLAISTHVGNDAIVNDKFPSHQDFVPDYLKFHLEPGTRVVVLSNEPDVVAQANQTLQPLGMKAQCVTERQVVQGQVAFTMTFMEVSKLELATPSIAEDSGLEETPVQ